jgi:hypothetical protein
MRIYIFYLITALLISWMILFLHGVSAGFASYAPISALLGSVILFTIAAPVFIYNVRIGLIIGLIGCLLMLPYMFMIVKGVFEDGVFNWGILIGVLPTVLILLSTYFTVKPLLVKSTLVSGIPSNAVVKLLLSVIPLALFILYLLLYGQYWSWEMFRI